MHDYTKPDSEFRAKRNVKKYSNINKLNVDIRVEC